MQDNQAAFQRMVAKEIVKRVLSYDFSHSTYPDEPAWFNELNSKHRYKILQQITQGLGVSTTISMEEIGCELIRDVHDRCLLTIFFKPIRQPFQFLGEHCKGLVGGNIPWKEAYVDYKLACSGELYEFERSPVYCVIAEINYIIELVTRFPDLNPIGM